jgi:hypothetical protein
MHRYHIFSHHLRGTETGLDTCDFVRTCEGAPNTILIASS